MIFTARRCQPPTSTNPTTPNPIAAISSSHQPQWAERSQVLVVAGNTASATSPNSTQPATEACASHHSARQGQRERR